MAMAAQVSDGENQIYIDKSSVKRLGKPFEIARAVAFLADREQSHVDLRRRPTVCRIENMRREPTHPAPFQSQSPVPEDYTPEV